jgi:Tol biopolymer transport system component
MTLDEAGNVTEMTQYTDGKIDGQPAVSPDGKKIAFVRWDGEDEEIYVMRADQPAGLNNRPVKLTNTPASVHDKRPNWSPDGTKIAYFRSDDATRTSDILVMNANGSGKNNLSH